jgi:glutamate dehydrogenase/leucine dehydrogenase
MALMQDIMNLTDQNLDEWSMQIRSNPNKMQLTADNIQKNVPLTATSYQARYGKKELDEMRTAAGVAVTTRAPKNDHTQSLRSLAGIL